VYRLLCLFNLFNISVHISIKNIILFCKQYILFFVEVRTNVGFLPSKHENQSTQYINKLCLTELIGQFYKNVLSKLKYHTYIVERKNCFTIDHRTVPHLGTCRLHMVVLRDAGLRTKTQFNPRVQ
jgi:hypothetical protein